MKILLYLTGSISVYKTIDLARNLTNIGHKVKVILSESAEHFIKKEIFPYLGILEAFGPNDDFSNPSEKINHIELANWCDIFVTVPATANTISHFNFGLTKDLGTTVYLALPLHTPKLIFPAMNTKMLQNEIIDQNIKSLRARKNTFIFPTDDGTLACGEVGLGKLLSVDHIETIISCWPLKVLDKMVLISTGASIAPLDDVRYLTNPASGSTGFEIAKIFLHAGYKVNLISGLYSSDIFAVLKHHPSFNLFIAKTTNDYLNLTQQLIDTSSVFISAAAIGDISFNYRPGKIKKDQLNQTIDIASSPDVLRTVLSSKKDNQFFIGFAAEAILDDEILRKKWVQKPVDLLIGTEVNSGTQNNEIKGFRNKTANYKLFEKNATFFEGSLSKNELSTIILERVTKWLN